MNTATTVGGIDVSLAATAELLAMALNRMRFVEVRNISERLDALLDHRIAQMALSTPAARSAS